jgi:hypothetical protein
MEGKRHELFIIPGCWPLGSAGEASHFQWVDLALKMAGIANVDGVDCLHCALQGDKVDR